MAAAKEERVESNRNQSLRLILSAIIAIATTVIGAVVTIKVAQMSSTIDKIHVATNSGRTEILRLVVAQSKRIADQSKDPADIVDYERALKNLAEAEEANKVAETK